jgi:hypothetical protein
VEAVVADFIDAEPNPERLQILAGPEPGFAGKKTGFSFSALLCPSESFP